MKDCIHLRGLELPVLIGVPEAERQHWQTLNADLSLEVPTSFEQMEDNLSATVDYAAVALRLRVLAAERPRKLIETLAHEIAAVLLQEFCAVRVSVELRKRVLPGCDHVAVSLTRSR